MIRFFSFILVCTVLTMFLHGSEALSAEKTSNDYWTKEKWRVSTPEEQGAESRKLAKTVGEILANEWNVHSLTVIRNGYMVMDASFHPFFPDMMRDIASVTKSVSSTLVGIALSESNGKAGSGFFPGAECVEHG